jgi:hypothetical protein
MYLFNAITKINYIKKLGLKHEINDEVRKLANNWIIN